MASARRELEEDGGGSARALSGEDGGGSAGASLGEDGGGSAGALSGEDGGGSAGASLGEDGGGSAGALLGEDGGGSAGALFDRPAFYALRSGGWRDLVTLLHPPYTAWHLSYVALGAAAAPHIYANRLAAALLAFFLAVGISAHALDELHGRPLGTKLTRRSLIALSLIAFIGAIGIGIAGIIVVSPLIAPLVLVGGLLVPAYNLELAGGRFHNDIWFALAWGGFPAFTGYFVNSLTIRPAGLLVAAACCLLSAAQRQLSTPVRRLRRDTTEVTGRQHLRDGEVVELTRAGLSAPLEGALRTLWIALVLLAVGLVAVHP